MKEKTQQNNEYQGVVLWEKYGFGQESVRMPDSDEIDVCSMDGPQRSINQAEKNASVVDEMSFKLGNIEVN